MKLNGERDIADIFPEPITDEPEKFSALLERPAIDLTADFSKQPGFAGVLRDYDHVAAERLRTYAALHNMTEADRNSVPVGDDMYASPRSGWRYDLFDVNAGPIDERLLGVAYYVSAIFDVNKTLINVENDQTSQRPLTIWRFPLVRVANEPELTLITRSLYPLSDELENVDGRLAISAQARATREPIAQLSKEGNEFPSFDELCVDTAGSVAEVARAEIAESWAVSYMRTSNVSGMTALPEASGWTRVGSQYRLPVNALHGALDKIDAAQRRPIYELLGAELSESQRNISKAIADVLTVEAFPSLCEALKSYDVHAAAQYSPVLRARVEWLAKNSAEMRDELEKEFGSELKNRFNDKMSSRLAAANLGQQTLKKVVTRLQQAHDMNGARPVSLPQNLNR